MPNTRNRDNDRNQSRSEQESLQRREYRGPNGEIHHHTRTYMEQHGGSKNNDKNRNDR